MSKTGSFGDPERRKSARVAELEAEYDVLNRRYEVIRHRALDAEAEVEKLRARVADLTDERDGGITDLLRCEEDRDEAKAERDDFRWRANIATQERDDARAERDRLKDSIASAMTSLATGPAKDGYAYDVLRAALEGRD